VLRPFLIDVEVVGECDQGRRAERHVRTNWEGLFQVGIISQSV
jgi:hypothetical protein